jgi:hypothetical protein
MNNFTVNDNNFVTTQYGPSLIFKHNMVIFLNIKNLIKAYGWIEKIYFRKRLILIKKTRIINQNKPFDYRKKNKLLNYYDNKGINYWRYYNVIFSNFDYPYTNYMDFKKYKIRSIIIDHGFKKIIIKFEQKDLFLLVHFLRIKAESLEWAGIPAKSIKIGDRVFYTASISTLFDHLRKTNELVINLHSASTDVIRDLVYPTEFDSRSGNELDTITLLS